MGRYREKTLTKFFTRLTHGLGGKRRPAIAPPPELPGTPAPQTSLIIDLPDELILSILSHIAPEPQLTGHYALFRIKFGNEIDNDNHQRVEFLRRLSMTCRAMRLRLLPWVWEHLEGIQLPWYELQRFEATAQVLRADPSLGMNVKFMTMHPVTTRNVPLFIKCLKSLPNLHTLEIRWGHCDIAAPLKNALKGVQLPHIKALTILPPAYPFLRHCRNVEDVVFVTESKSRSSDKFFGSLVSNWDSKVKRLTVPLVSRGNPSRYVAACPRLTELTAVCPNPNYTPYTETGFPDNTAISARSAILELVNACKALPDFDTLQIVYFLLCPYLIYRFNSARDGGLPSTKQWNQSLKDLAKGTKDWAAECLKKPKIGCQEGEGRKKITLRIIQLSADQKFHQGSMNVDVEEYEV